MSVDVDQATASASRRVQFIIQEPQSIEWKLTNIKEAVDRFLQFSAGGGEVARWWCFVDLLGRSRACVELGKLKLLEAMTLRLR
jgi:hypothetical protein